MAGAVEKVEASTFFSLCGSVYSLWISLPAGRQVCNNNLRTYTEGSKVAQSSTEDFFNSPLGRD
jgi:hypothetical protein